VLQYNFCGGLLQISSQKTLNYGRWHTLEAVRQKEKGVLKIDGIPEFDGSAPEKATMLQFSVLFILV
jgi:hypothetical protein